MMGPEMLLRSLGFDPEELKKKFVEAQTLVVEGIKHFDAELKTIRAQQEEILTLLRSQGQQNGGAAKLALVKGSTKQGRRKHG